MVARKNSKYLNSRIIMIFFFALFSFLGCTLTNEEITQRNEYLERAQKYYRGKKYMNALQQIEKALEIDPNSKRGLVSKGWTLFYLGKIDEAEKSFLAAYDIDNADMWCHQGLAALYFKRANKVGAKLEKTISDGNDAGDSGKNVEDFEKKFEKQRKEARKWFDKSLFHYEESIKYTDTGQDLYNMIASVHTMIALPYYGDAQRYFTSPSQKNTKDYLEVFLNEGLPHYEKALSYLEKYIKYTDEELLPIDQYIEAKKLDREKIGILEEEHTTLDRQIEIYRVLRKQNRIRNRIAQGFAGDIDFKIASLMKEAKKNTTDTKKKLYYESLAVKHLAVAKNRIFDMIRDYPEMKSGYKNLANIAKLEGDYQTAMKYLEEYITKNPMIRPVEKIEVKQEIETMGTKTNNKK